MPDPIISQACTEARAKGLPVDQATCEAHAQDTALCEQSAADAITDNDASGLTSCLSSGRAKAAFAKLQSGGGGAGPRRSINQIKNDIARPPINGSSVLPITVDSTNQNAVRTILTELATRVNKADFNAADDSTKAWITNFLTNSDNDTGVLDSLFKAAGQNLGLIAVKGPGGGSFNWGSVSAKFKHIAIFPTNRLEINATDKDPAAFGWAYGGSQDSVTYGSIGLEVPSLEVDLAPISGSFRFALALQVIILSHGQVKGIVANEADDLQTHIDENGQACWDLGIYGAGIVGVFHNEYLRIEVSPLNFAYYSRTARDPNADVNTAKSNGLFEFGTTKAKTFDASTGAWMPMLSIDVETPQFWGVSIFAGITLGGLITIKDQATVEGLEHKVNSNFFFLGIDIGAAYHF